MLGRRLLLVAVAGLAGFTASMGLADPTTQEAAKQDAKAFAKTLIPTVATDAKTQPTANSVPGYVSGNPSQTSYYKNPNALTADAASQASSNQGYSFIRNSLDQRPQVSQTDLDATVSRSMAIQDDPSSYVSGFSAGGSTGNCHALPPGTGSPGTYEQSCNSGYGAGDSETRSCTIPLKATYVPGYLYSCGYARLREFGAICLQGTPQKCVEPDFVDEDIAELDSCKGFEASSQCKLTSETFTDNGRSFTAGRRPYRSTISTRTYTCSGETSSPAGGSSSLSYWKVTAAPATLIGNGQIYAGSVRDESQCTGMPGNDVVCDAPVEACTDSSPQTRLVNGQLVTQACWQWTRTYQCRNLVPTNDCSQLTAQGCTYVRQDCLTDETPCLTYEDVYSCPIPGNDTSKQYICDGDVYCINGDCETIDRTPNTEFGQAAAALNSVAQAGRELDPNNLTIFQGTRETCSKTIAGLTNCCAPRGLPIIGGGCDNADKVLKQKKDKGLCHYVGSYCSSKVLGICLKKKEADCCYLSKLSRIIQEQGRPQLGLDFGTAKKSICTGFTVDQFSRLDLSRMDFSEVMADFVNAAKLPDDLQTATTMQAKIQAYYSSH